MSFQVPASPCAAEGHRAQERCHQEQPGVAKAVHLGQHPQPWGPKLLPKMPPGAWGWQRAHVPLSSCSGQGRAGPTCGLEVLGDKWRVAAAPDSWCCGLGVWVFVPPVAGQDGHSGTSGPAMTWVISEQRM